jgi:hypothetical protein
VSPGDGRPDERDEKHPQVAIPEEQHRKVMPQLVKEQNRNQEGRQLPRPGRRADSVKQGPRDDQRQERGEPIRLFLLQSINLGQDAIVGGIGRRDVWRGGQGVGRFCIPELSIDRRDFEFPIVHGLARQAEGITSLPERAHVCHNSLRATLWRLICTWTC